jgi:hypothetical protein
MYSQSPDSSTSFPTTGEVYTNPLYGKMKKSKKSSLFSDAKNKGKSEEELLLKDGMDDDEPEFIDSSSEEENPKSSHNNNNDNNKSDIVKRSHNSPTTGRIESLRTSDQSSAPHNTTPKTWFQSLKETLIDWWELLLGTENDNEYWCEEEDDDYDETLQESEMSDRDPSPKTIQPHELSFWREENSK